MINEINIFAVDEIIAVGKMFEEQGMKFSSLFVKDNSAMKVSKKVLDVHGCDLSRSGGKTIAFCMIRNEAKFHRMWFELEGYRLEEFNSWKLTKEDIEYL